MTYYFLDPQGGVQGPFPAAQMRAWLEQGYFEAMTPVATRPEGPFTLLGLRKQPPPAAPQASKKREQFESLGHELFACCAAGRRREAYALLDAGADAGWKNRNGVACLAVAAMAGDAPLCRALARAGAGVDSRNIWNQTALHDAAAADQPTAVAALVDLGADIEAVDYDGARPAHLACKNGSAAALRELVSRGVSTCVRDYHNWTPAMFALNYPDADTKNLLIRLVQRHVE
ncbi:hypothetical protein CTAYLR_000728 [Chrysophaeum taylorii]|uniref:GYF domain-containing protein n=1 Tax=Chrysophaeum taylorii TaxID=2483200 RepID=A0AAD7U8V7_9STRA|nr:hypothetical protein CTAYLR_000728 [Chrysophaeum taylorii]